MNSKSEEDYLKAIYSLSVSFDGVVSTNAIADSLDTKASSVTDMIKKLANKKLVNYKKYHGVSLTEDGRKAAVHIIRKHRLWEVFLVEKLKFSWDEVHDIAEQLEHIRSLDLVERLDKFLDFPKYDPHGDPIPDKHGKMVGHKDIMMVDLKSGENGIVVGVKDTSSEFLKYLDKLKLGIGTKIDMVECYDFDGSREIKINNKTTSVSELVTKNIYVNKC